MIRQLGTDKYQLGKYITVISQESVRDSEYPCYDLRSSKDLKVGLGTIEYYSPWHKFCYFPSPRTVFDDSCLQDIINFLNELNRGDKTC